MENKRKKEMLNHFTEMANNNIRIFLKDPLLAFMPHLFSGPYK